MLTDNVVKAFAIGALLTYGVALVLAMTSRMGHWPLTVGLFVVASGTVVMVYLDGLKWDRFTTITLAVCGAFVLIAVWQAAASTRASMMALAAAITLQCIVLVALLLFLYLFRLDRLW